MTGFKKYSQYCDLPTSIAQIAIKVLRDLFLCLTQGSQEAEREDGEAECECLSHLVLFSGADPSPTDCRT